MKKTLSIIMIIIGFCLVVIIKIGPSKETSWLFAYGDWVPMIVAAAIIIPGWIMYKKSR
ncbi:hypothetical protein SAMN05421542_4042 [Chryseobacterium jejuense]|uniref:Uncharacterized protein n=1 Tax=Chryseobacterium jejuense TaxID=445960 RepID=A0A2X2WIM7_CHRJE|nr:hypothetical protein SAMN05421542_4042 [Chryseobacterium jejuense]SQB43242.1 Uncharacterised protein [Chryseobacterium jejuense]